MTLVECGMLLAFIAELDYRKFTDATVEAWYAVLGRYRFAEARAAVIEHYDTDEPEFLKPNHITSQIRRTRSQRLAGITRIEVADVDDPRGPNATREDFDRYHANRELIRETIASGVASREDYHQYLRGRTPWADLFPSPLGAIEA